MLGEFAAPKQFERLALSLSGGGVRAVGFHLGTLDILERLNLLKKVRVLSTVSGGSLVGIGYALSLKKNQTFEDFFNAFFEFLPRLDTMKNLVKSVGENSLLMRLGKKSRPNRPTLISAMADIYNDYYFKKYFDNPRFGIFWEEEPEIHLQHLVFNATDFKTGLPFRFQHSKGSKEVGNEEVFLNEDHARELRMSDIMTASACIPGLLEPMFLPVDFNFSDRLKKQISKHIKENCFEDLDYVALMDGGIVDNQGISSILRALGILRPVTSSEKSPLTQWEYALQRTEKVHKPNAGFGAASKDGADSSVETGQEGVDLEDLPLIIISDTPGYRKRDKRYFPKNDILKRPEHRNSGGSLWDRFMRWTLKVLLNLTLMDYALIWLLLILVSLASLLVIIAGMILVSAASPPEMGFIEAITDAIAQSEFPGVSNYGMIVMVVVAFFSLILNLIAAFLISIMIGQLDKVLGSRLIPAKGRRQETESLWKYIRRLKLGELWHMFELRLFSLLRLTKDIFMNRVRQLSYYTALENRDLKARVVPNEIFKLVVVHDENEKRTMSRIHRFPLPRWLQEKPPEEMMNIVEAAASMKTQLYLDDPGDENLKRLVACGQITACYNLMEYFWEYHSNGNPKSEDPFEASPAAGEIFRNARTLWEQMKNDPYDLVDKRLAG